jgi:hypothetical protein
MTLQRGTTRRFDAHGYVKFGLLFAWQNCVRRSKEQGLFAFVMFSQDRGEHGAEDGFWAGDSAGNLPAVEALIVFQPLTQYNMKWAGFSCREQHIIFVYICHLERSSTFTYAIYAGAPHSHMPYMHSAWQGDSVTFWSKEDARKAFVSTAGNAT